MTADQLEVAVLDRGRARRKFRRLAGARLEALLTEARQSRAPAGGGSGRQRRDGQRRARQRDGRRRPGR